MSLKEQVAANLPYLRRYARALSGSQAIGDTFVKTTLEAILADPELKASLSGGRVALYRAFHTIWSKAQDQAAQAGNSGNRNEADAHQNMPHATPLSREALLLTTLEDFSPLNVTDIMDLPLDRVEALVQVAIREIDSIAKTSVLIIEDEPLISIQLENLVSGLGHQIFGTAATRAEVQELVKEQMPGLVLADIRLADGSSGLDAVDDILAVLGVPVIFITAYPERLLTGDRREPTYLVTKPFQEATVSAAIGQALFFASDHPN